MGHSVTAPGERGACQVSAPAGRGYRLRAAPTPNAQFRRLRRAASAASELCSARTAVRGRSESRAAERPSSRDWRATPRPLRRAPCAVPCTAQAPHRPDPRPRALRRHRHRPSLAPPSARRTAHCVLCVCHTRAEERGAPLAPARSLHSKTAPRAFRMSTGLRCWSRASSHGPSVS